MGIILSSDPVIDTMQQYEYHLGIISMLITFALKTVCFIIGYLTIKLGYELIKSGVKGEFKFTSGIPGLTGGLASSSPGLLFVLLGICIVGYAMYVTKSVEIGTKPKENQRIQKERPLDIPLPTKLRDSISDSQ